MVVYLWAVFERSGKCIPKAMMGTIGVGPYLLGESDLNLNAHEEVIEITCY